MDIKLVGCMLLLVVTISVQAENFRIGSFNVQVFGQTKAGKPDVMAALAKIVQRYDILLIQEIRDKKNTAIHELVRRTNDRGPALYDLVISERLGRSSSKEQYAFLYRWKAGVKVLDTYQWPDNNDVFEREPFAVKFSSAHTMLTEFVLAGVHVDPDVAPAEINSLESVHQDLVKHWATDNIVIMGDLNADCTYLNKKESSELLLRAEQYTWLIGDDADTTTKSTDCAYDRIIMSGARFVSSVVPNSAKVFRYDKAYGFNETMTTAISDHYPVEYQMKGAGSTEPSTSSSATSIALVKSWVSWIMSLFKKHAEL